ncbi:hypothetical protein GCM10023324_37970 [Streptomyces youssoufiensis]
MTPDRLDLPARRRRHARLIAALTQLIGTCADAASAVYWLIATAPPGQEAVEVDLMPAKKVAGSAAILLDHARAEDRARWSAAVTREQEAATRTYAARFAVAAAQELAEQAAGLPVEHGLPLPTTHQSAAMGLASAGGEVAARWRTDPREAVALVRELVASGEHDVGEVLDSAVDSAVLTGKPAGQLLCSPRGRGCTPPLALHRDQGRCSGRCHNLTTAPRPPQATGPSPSPRAGPPGPGSRHRGRPKLRRPSSARGRGVAALVSRAPAGAQQVRGRQVRLPLPPASISAHRSSCSSRAVMNLCGLTASGGHANTQAQLRSVAACPSSKRPETTRLPAIIDRLIIAKRLFIPLCQSLQCAQADHSVRTGRVRDPRALPAHLQSEPRRRARAVKNIER